MRIVKLTCGDTRDPDGNVKVMAVANDNKKSCVGWYPSVMLTQLEQELIGETLQEAEFKYVRWILNDFKRGGK